jgi:hypothetical protein
MDKKTPNKYRIFKRKYADGKIKFLVEITEHIETDFMDFPQPYFYSRMEIVAGGSEPADFQVCHFNTYDEAVALIDKLKEEEKVNLIIDEEIFDFDIVDKNIVEVSDISDSEASIILETVLDTLIEVGNGTTDRQLHEQCDQLFKFRDKWFVNKIK